MRSLFIVGQIRPDSLGHHQNQRPIIHVKPITTAHKLIVGVACERAIGFAAKVQADRSVPYITGTAVASSFDRTADIQANSDTPILSANFARVIRTFASNRPVGSSAFLVSRYCASMGAWARLWLFACRWKEVVGWSRPHTGSRTRTTAAGLIVARPINHPTKGWRT
jgi:hypothetical protein